MTTDNQLEAFVEQLDRRGSDLESWPVEEAQAARLLLAEDPQARRALAQAQTLDNLFAGLPATSPPPGLQARIAASVATTRWWERLADWFQVAIWRPLAISAAALACGFLIGVLQPQADEQLLSAGLELLALGELEELRDAD